MTNELRIGNLLQGAQGPVTVTQILEKGYVTIKEAGTRFEVGVCLKFIPLTEECLLTFGFDKRGSVYMHPELPNLLVLRPYPDGSFDFECESDSASSTICEIKYLHQLQNAFLVFTGKELNQ